MPSPLLLGRAFRVPPRDADQGPATAGRPRPAPSVLIGGDIVTLDRKAHVLTIAPPDSNRGGSTIIPNLLAHPGPVVVVDPSGAYYTATARARAELGPVLRLDPFRVVDRETDALNPLHLIGLTGADVESDCQLVADLVSPRAVANDPWEFRALALLSAIVGYVHTVPEKGNKLSEVVRTFTSDDVVYNLAVVLDTIGKRLPTMAYNEIVGFLNSAEVERSRVLATVNAHHKPLLSEQVHKSIDTCSIPLADVVAGTSLTAYLMVPRARLRSHAALLRIWLGTLLHCVTGRRAVPSTPTLFLLDEAAQLGHFPALEAALTVCRGFGFQVWTFWDDVSQLRHLYPAAWPALVGGCTATQVFMVRDFTAAAEAAALFGLEPEDLLGLGPDEQVVRLDRAPLRLKKLDYLTEPMFVGRFDPIPQDSPAAQR